MAGAEVPASAGIAGPAAPAAAGAGSLGAGAGGATQRFGSGRRESTIR